MTLYTAAVARIEITFESDQPRLDRALAGSIDDLSRTAIARFIEEGRVELDGEPATKPSQPVQAGQTATVTLPAPRPATVEAEEIPLTILLEDSDLAVIDKPPSLVVHPAAGHSAGTLVNALLFHIDDLSGVGGEIRPGIVHRLDKDTSGVLVVAKNDLTHRRLSEIWGSGDVVKEYVAVVYGTPSSEKGVIDAPIGRHPRHRKKMAIVPSGRPARTEYRVTDRLRHVSVLGCLLHTGRTHQIRVHLASIGHAVVGDPVYSGPQWKGIPDKRIQKLLREFPRQALHAARITFPHPSSGASTTVEAPLPADMAGLIAALRA